MKNILYLLIVGLMFGIQNPCNANNMFLGTNSITYKFQNNDWIISSKSTSSYLFDTLNDRVKEQILSIADVPTYKFTYLYDSIGNVVRCQRYSINGKSGTWFMEIEYRYNYFNGLQIFEQQSTFDSTGKLLYDHKDSSSYENGRLKQVNYWDWNNGIWEISVTDDYSVIDSANRLEQLLRYDYQSGKKNLYSRVTYQYDANHLPLSISYENNLNSGKDTIPNWVLWGQNTYTYNTKGQVKSLDEQSYGIFTHQLENENLYLYTYNDHDKISEMLKQYNTSQGFVNDFKVEYFYADFPTDVNDAQNFAGNIASISPNPVSDILNIQLPSGSFGSAQVKIFSQNGEKVLARNVEIESGSSSFRLDNLTSLSSGVYLVSVNINGTFYRQKFIKM